MLSAASLTLLSSHQSLAVAAPTREDAVPSAYMYPLQSVQARLGGDLVMLREVSSSNATLREALARVARGPLQSSGVARVLGVCTGAADKRLRVVSELCTHGTLRAFLRLQPRDKVACIVF